jgi:hypothetical protein
MKNLMLILISTITLASTFAHAEDANIALPNCTKKESLSKQYYLWRMHLQDYLDQYDTLDKQTQFSVSYNAVKRISQTANDFAKETGFAASGKLTSDSKDLIKEIDAKHVPREAALKRLKSQLIGFEDNMDEMLTQAQIANPYCEIVTRGYITSPVYMKPGGK